MSQTHSPFKFLDSYQQTDIEVFFGRKKETLNLYNALSGVKHLMVYGPSGSGKTSLVECGLRNQFSDADWFAITIRRGSDINASVFASINKALIEKIETDPVTKMPVDRQIEFGQAIEQIFAERYQPVYLLFDQFEELLISGDAEEKKKFFTQLNKLILNKVPCRILLILREEFIGHLSEFESLCPSIFQYRFRVEKMGRKSVEEVIFNILEAPKYNAYFKVEDSQKLAESILSKLPDKRKEIELAHVQVFLGELWDRALSVKKSNQLPLLSVDLIHDDDNLEAVLESFLKKQMSELEINYGERVPLELLAAMISERFTKLQLSEGDITRDLEHKKIVSKKPISELLKELEQRRILRTIKVGDETQYEISHDVLALVVGQNLTEEMKMREKAGDIYKVYGERQGLFSQDDIDYLRPFQRSLSYPPELQVRIDKSIVAIKKQREEELAKTRKRLRVVYSLLFGTLLALIMAGYYGFEAKRQTKIAEANSLISEAKSVVISDPTLALRYAEQAMIKDNNPRNEKVALKIYYENSFYKKVGIHDKPINSIAISPDQQTIVTCSEDSLACLWNLKGDTLHVFRGHTNRVISVAFSPDGKKIITGSWDKTARLWDLKGKTLHIFKDFSRAVNSVMFSPGGDSILISSMDTTVRLFDLKGNKLQVFKGYSDYVRSVAFSPDGKSILAGSGDTKAYLWDLQGKLLKEFKGHSGFINSVAFSHSGDTILTGSDDKTAILWNLKGDTLKTFKGHSDDIGSVAYSPDGKSVLTGSDDKTARLWDLKGKLIQEFKGHTGYVRGVCFSPNGKNIFTGSADGTARLWEIKKNSVCEFKVNSDPVYSIAYSHEGDKFLSGSNDGAARLWDINDSILKTFDDKRKIGVLSVAFSPSGDSIITGYRDGIARLWNLKGGTLKIFKDRHKGSVNSVAFSPDGKTILTGSDNQTARLWNVKGDTLQIFKGHKGSIISVAFSPDGKTILTGSGDSTARLWDLNGKTTQIFKGHSRSVYSVAYSPDGETILTGSEDQTALLWDLKGFTLQKFKGHSDYVRSVAFSKDGKSILTGSEDKTARLWDLKGNTLQEFKGHTKEVLSVAFSPDEKTILTSSFDSTIRLRQIEMTLKDFLENNEIEPLSAEQKEIYRITN